MRSDLTIDIELDGTLPVFLQVARAITREIERGRLRAGELLPSTRQLARRLGVHRKTVTAGYDELRRQGWIESERARGTYVSRALPERVTERRRAARADHAGFDLPPRVAVRSPANPPAELRLLGGLPDLRLLPSAELGRAYRRAVTGVGASRLMGYADPRGEPRLRAALVELLARSRGVRVSDDALIVVRGTQQGLYLAARALLRPGDRVAIEAYSHPAARGALTLAGVELEPIPVDEEGLDVAVLEARCARSPIRAVYVTPHHQLPTTVTLTAARRLRLLELARRRRILVLEDDYDHEFRYEGRPVLPLASGDRHGVVVYLGTLSKLLAPGLRLGFLTATPDVVRRLVSYRELVDQQGDHVVERAVADLLEEGEIERHAHRARRAYRARRDALCAELRRHLPSLEFVAPPGGMAIWARAPGIDVDAWARRAYAAGVAFQPASHFIVGAGPRNLARLGFASCDEQELAIAARRLAESLPSR